MRTDDLGAIPIKALMARNPGVDWAGVTDVLYGCANQAGEDNRNVAHMASLLAGLPVEVPGATINRLCGSGLDAVGTRRARHQGRRSHADDRRRRREHEPRALRDAQGGKRLLARGNAVYDTTIGWRFVNKLMKEQYGVDSMPETAENVANDYGIEREAQDRMALASQLKAVAAQQRGYFDAEITPVTIPQRKGEAIVVAQDEHPRETSLEALAKLKGVVRPDGTVTAGNASGVNDGACALLLADEATAAKNGLTPRARVVGMATAGVAAARDGHRPGAGHAEGAGAHRPEAGADGRDRAERSLRRAGPGRAAHARAAGRRPARQPQRRRHRAGPPARRLRRAAGDHGGQPAARGRRPLRAVHDVHRRGAGHRGDPRTGLKPHGSPGSLPARG